MAGKASGVAGEYSGTDKPSGNNSGEPIAGGSGPLDPDTAAGIGGGSSGGSSEPFDATIHVGPDKFNSDGSRTRKRGRKTGSGSNGNRSQKAPPDLKAAIEGLSKTLVILHTGIAGITSTPELMIDKDEGDMLAAASANVMQQFDLRPDPKVQAILGLIMAAGTVYGPRAYLISVRKAQEKQETKAGTAGVYGAGGEAQGTTTYKAGAEPVN